MRYIKAEEVLPSELLSLVQKYVDGQMLYVPKRDSERNAWGTVSGARESLAQRNRKIYEQYEAGQHPRDLASQYCLSEKSIQRILRASISSQISSPSKSLE